jgi:hypothetical protein
MQAARSSWVARLADPRSVLIVAIVMLVASVASLGVRIAFGSDVDFGGTVVDARTKQPVAGAHIVAMGIHERTSKTGSFTVSDVHRGTKLRFSADNYHHRDVEAIGDPSRVTLQPIAVTGKVTSSFTGDGMGATVRGTQATKTRSDGTFTTYGVGPGDTVTVTAFGHAAKKMKVPASREMKVSLALGRLDPKALLKQVPGYGFVDVPAGDLQQLRAEMTAADPEIGRAITGVVMRSITKGGKGIGFVIVTSLDPAIAALPGVQDAFLDEFSYGATKQRDIRIGTTRTRFASAEGITGYAWQRFAGFVQVFTEGSTDAKRVAETLIGARTAVPTESV